MKETKIKVMCDGRLIGELSSFRVSELRKNIPKIRELEAPRPQDFVAARGSCKITREDAPDA